MRVLYVGDPHVTVSELADSWALIELVNRTASEHEVDAIVFLGDQYHTHSLVHLQVMHFWMQALEHVWSAHTGSKLAKVFLLVGNHDKGGDSNQQHVHAMLAHKDRNPMVTVVDEPTRIGPGVIAIPHRDSGEDFLSLCSEYPEDATVVCHQTFNGGQYDNGFYAKDGIDPNLVPQPMILSGHIHAPQSFGKVWYVGAPRWRTASDANVERNIWVVEHDAQGNIVSKTPVRTGETCRRIWDLTMEESDTSKGFPFFRDQYDTKKDDVRITLKGGDEYLKTYGPQLERAGFRVRTIRTDKVSAPRVRESEGVSTAFKKFVDAFEPKWSTPKEVLHKLVQERLHA